mgnify:CR=1 FL=1
METISKIEYHIIRNTFVDNLEREVGQKIDDSLFKSIDVALGDTLKVEWDNESEVERLRCEKCGISSEEVSLISEADICYQCEKLESEVE